MVNKFSKYFTLSLTLPLIGCQNPDYLDRVTQQNRSDITDALIANKSKSAEERAQEQQAPIPKISNMLSFPKPPQFTQGNQIISFSVTDDVDLKDVLIELGRVTGLDVDVDPAISGGIILNAKNRPLIEVIERICDLGHLRYSFENGVLTFKSDTLYNKHYVTDYLIDGTLWDEVVSNLSSILSTKATEDSKVTANKSAGMITIYANDIGQKAAKEYLEEVAINASAQVLIEAKVVEVTLNDKYNVGINWSFLDGTTTISSSPPSPTGFAAALTAGVANSIFNDKGSFNIAALEEFGDVRAISSPRINALNNQKATLNFLDKLVYFTLETENTTTSASSIQNTQTVNATKQEEPVGVELNIVPSIHVKDQQITLFVNPTLSIKSGDAKDPSVGPTGLPLNNLVPIVQTRELKTTMKIHSGDTLVIGGLMKEDATNDDKGIPYLSQIPILGNLFKFVSKSNKIVETVIFIKATIIAPNSGVIPYDKELNKKFSATKRPF